MAVAYKHPVGTRAALNALAAANGIVPQQVYVISDEARLALGLTANSYQAFAKQGEGGGGATNVTLDFGNDPVVAKTFTFAHAGASTGQKVLMHASASMPDGLASDELEMDALICGARVSAADTIEAVIRAVPGPLNGRRTFTYILG